MNILIWVAFLAGLVIGFTIGRVWSAESWVNSRERKQMFIENDRR